MNVLETSNGLSGRTDRRGFLRAAAGIAATGLLSGYGRDWTGNEPVRYPDPDVVALDPRFEKYKLFNSPIKRLYTGMLWAEGPAWNGVGKYLVWSDIPNNVQHRWLDDNGRVSVMRSPAGNSNGNTFDFQGRQISCEHLSRSVVRYEHDGSVTTLADNFGGTPFNAPNDVVVHPDGGIWFTDPGYGSIYEYEGKKRELQLKEAIYRIDPQSGAVKKVTDDVVKPNGLCFSEDYKRLYAVDTGADAPKPITAWDVVNQTGLKGTRILYRMVLDGKAGGSDGIRCDVDGNIWASASGGEGFDGVHIIAPEGELIGQIRLPEICSNLAFGGPKRNRLFMTASQSLYSVFVETRGAHIA